MSTLEIIELCIIAVAFITLLIYSIVKCTKNHLFSKILTTIESSIKEAETLFPGTGRGEEKKQYVVSKVEEKCNELGIPYSLLKKLVSIAIDKIIANFNILSK